MSEVRSEEETLRQLIVEIRLLEGTGETLQNRLNMIEGALTDLHIAQSTLQGIKDQKPGLQLLIPVGGNTYVKAKLDDPKTVIAGIGADVALEKGIDEAQESMNTQLTEFEKVRASLQQQLVQVAGRLEQNRAQFNELTGQMGEGSQVVRQA
jgi:prefoldin alpha subunit